MDTDDVLQSKVIDFLRFPMIIGVVVVHAYFGSIKGLEVPQCGVPYYHFFSFIMSKVIANLAVPMFFFVSGYLFFYKTSFSFSSYKKKLYSRISSLLIPYLFWNFLIIVVHWGINLLSPVELTSGAYKLVRDYTAFDYLRSFWNISGQPINGVLWFIRDLMIMVIFSPLVYFLLRYLRWPLLLVFGMLWILDVQIFSIPQLNTIFFFSLGAWFSINKRNFVGDFKSFYPQGIILYLVFAVAIFILRGATTFSMVLNAGILLGIPAVISLVTYFVEKKHWKIADFLTSSCFVVYAFHMLPINVLNRLLFKIITPVTDWQLLTIYISVPLFVVIIDLLLYHFLKKMTPKFCAVITGGRS